MAGCQRLYQAVTRKIPKRNRGRGWWNCRDAVLGWHIKRRRYPHAPRRSPPGITKECSKRCVNRSSNSSRMHFSCLSNINFPRGLFLIGICIARLRYRFAYLLMAWSVRNTYSVTITGYASRHAIAWYSPVQVSCCVRWKHVAFNRREIGAWFANYAHALWIQSRM